MISKLPLQSEGSPDAQQSNGNELHFFKFYKFIAAIASFYEVMKNHAPNRAYIRNLINIINPPNGQRNLTFVPEQKGLCFISYKVYRKLSNI